MTTPLCSQPRRDNHSPPVPASPGLTGCLGYREEASLHEVSERTHLPLIAPGRV